MRKILLATPVRLGLDGSYMAGLVPSLVQRFTDIELHHAILEGTQIGFARSELVHHARSLGCREIVFIDSDMGWTLEHLLRLCSHIELDVVGALYCKRKPGAPAWLLNFKPGAEVDEKTGLCEVNDIATGFMKIRIDTVFPALEKAHPHLEFFNFQQNLASPKPGTQWEFFPMGVEGPRTPASRLERIKALIRQTKKDGAIPHGGKFLNMIEEACYDEQPPSTLRGEDYMFCKMARECGFKIYADLGMPIIPHIGKIGFPILPEDVGLDKSGELMVNKGVV